MARWLNKVRPGIKYIKIPDHVPENDIDIYVNAKITSLLMNESHLLEHQRQPIRLLPWRDGFLVMYSTSKGETYESPGHGANLEKDQGGPVDNAGSDSGNRVLPRQKTRQKTKGNKKIPV